MSRKISARRKGSGTLVKRGGTLYARWTVDGKTFTRTTGTGNRREAEKELERLTAPFRLGGEARTLENVAARIGGVRAEIARHKDQEPALSILQGWAAYVASTKRPDTGPHTLRMYESQYSRLVRWLTTNRPDVTELRHVTPDTAQAFAKYLSGELSAGSFNKYMTLFRRMWKTLATPARLTVNVWDLDEINPRRDMPHSRRELTIEELASVCEAVSGEMRTLFAAGIYTGLRLGDAVRLAWGDVDLVRGIMSVAPRKTAHSAGGKRTVIPIHQALAGILAETPSTDRRGYVMPELAGRYEASSAGVCRKIQSVFERCSIKTAVQIPGQKRGRVEVGFHSLRHSFVSLCANAGTPLAIVQSLVGHSNPSMTRHYFHESETALIAAVGALPDVMHATIPEEAPGEADAARMAVAVDQLKAGFDAVGIRRIIAMLQE